MFINYRFTYYVDATQSSTGSVHLGAANETSDFLQSSIPGNRIFSCLLNILVWSNIYSGIVLV